MFNDIIRYFNTVSNPLLYIIINIHAYIMIKVLSNLYLK